MSTAETLNLNDEPGAHLDVLTRRVTQLRQEIESQQHQLDEAAHAVSEAHRVQAVLERDKALAQARAEAVEQQLDQAREERSLLTDRLATLVSERDLAVSSLGWWSRRRYHHRRATKRLHPAG
jgi:chromosome segregation ATPase